VEPGNLARSSPLPSVRRPAPPRMSGPALGCYRGHALPRSFGQCVSVLATQDSCWKRPWLAESAESEDADVPRWGWMVGPGLVQIRRPLHAIHVPLPPRLRSGLALPASPRRHQPSFQRGSGSAADHRIPPCRASSSFDRIDLAIDAPDEGTRTSRLIREAAACPCPGKAGWASAG